jgi:hypothetical protein
MGPADSSWTHHAPGIEAAYLLTVATIGLRHVTSRYFRMGSLDLFGRPTNARTPAPCSLSNHGVQANDREVLTPRSNNSLECSRCNRVCRFSVGRTACTGNGRGHAGPLPTAFQPVLAPQHQWLCPAPRGRCGGRRLPQGQLRRRRRGAEARAQSLADSCPADRVGALPIDVRRHDGRRRGARAFGYDERPSGALSSQRRAAWMVEKVRSRRPGRSRALTLLMNASFPVEPVKMAIGPGVPSPLRVLA